MTWPAVLLAAYPPDWRARYGDELEQLVRDLHDHGRRPAALGFDLLRGAAAAWLTGGRGLMSERSRGALITVLWSWVAFAATAAFFGHDLPHESTPGGIAILSPGPGSPLAFRALAGVPLAGLQDAYRVLFAAGLVGIAATVVAAIPFAVEAARQAKASHRRSTFVLMAVPPVVAAAWLGGLRLLPGSRLAGVLWLLVGLAGIAGSTQAVITIVRRTQVSTRTWRIGGIAAAAVTAAMLVATGATIAWGLLFRPSDASTWVTVTAILAVTTGRAAVALVGTRRRPADQSAASAAPATAPATPPAL
jgi:hypothetical protein